MLTSAETVLIHCHCEQDQREVAEAKQRRIDAREMIAQASRLNLGPTTGFGSFGFAGGAQGPSFQLASSDNYIYDPEDGKLLY
jgi:hypothetical protein